MEHSTNVGQITWVGCVWQQTNVALITCLPSSVCVCASINCLTQTHWLLTLLFAIFPWVSSFSLLLLSAFISHLASTLLQTLCPRGHVQSNKVYGCLNVRSICDCGTLSSLQGTFQTRFWNLSAGLRYKNSSKGWHLMLGSKTWFKVSVAVHPQGLAVCRPVKFFQTVSSWSWLCVLGHCRIETRTSFIQTFGSTVLSKISEYAVRILFIRIKRPTTN